MKVKKYYEANNADLDQKQFFLANLRIYICYLGTRTMEQICDLRFRINHYNLRICVLHTGKLHKFAVMRLWNGPKNLRTNKKPRFLTPLVKWLAKSEDAKLGEYKVIDCY